MRNPLLVSAALALFVGPGLARSPQDASPEGPSDEELLEVWDGLDQKARHDISEWLQFEVRNMQTFQLRLVRFVLSLEERDPGTWPLAEPAPVYDPKVHAPRQPIARRALEATDPTAERQHERMFGGIPERKLRRVWSYDWATGDLRRAGDDRDPELVFHNALHGFPPGLDLAEAVLLRLLDDGDERPALAAFGHAYTDRVGRVFPGITLYDAWSSGEAMEMPDVDILGIVHDVDDDWRSWTAPVPASKQDELYEHVGAIFRDARRHRSLREAMVRIFFTGDPVLRDGFDAHLLNLHGRLDLVSSDPTQIVEELPDVDDWEDWLAELGKKAERDEKFRNRAANRRWTLYQDGLTVRRTLVWVMTQYGALASD